MRIKKKVVIETINNKLEKENTTVRLIDFTDCNEIHIHCNDRFIYNSDECNFTGKFYNLLREELKRIGLRSEVKFGFDLNGTWFKSDEIIL